ncbi:MAG: hypothetical protein BWY15_01139 [Firmicutes bacterium ADurb.Bin193]|nr:MAG: hypothetical protein BWY15_01139 [Firmicutes bacterium ADurb.Bin193]
MNIYADRINITSAVSNLSWQNTLAELATTMSFDIAKSEAQHTNIYLPHEGSIIQMYTNDEIFRGIVLTVDDGSKTSNKYTVCDFGWYLNKSKETYQFNSMPAHKAIRKVCSDFNIEIDSIPELITNITKIYFDKTISEILQDILEICGGGYNLDVTPKGLRIYKIGSIYAYPEFRLSPNTHLIYSPLLRGNTSHSVSIEDMKNSVKVITEKEGNYSVKATLKDDSLISKYGLLQEIVKIDPEKENPNNVAKQKLSELSKTKETFSFEIIEAIDSYTRAGYVITVDGSEYIVEGSGHSIKNGIHYVKLDLRKFG